MKGKNYKEISTHHEAKDVTKNNYEYSLLLSIFCS